MDEIGDNLARVGLIGFILLILLIVLGSMLNNSIDEKCYEHTIIYKIHYPNNTVIKRKTIHHWSNRKAYLDNYNNIYSINVEYKVIESPFPLEIINHCIIEITN